MIETTLIESALRTPAVLSTAVFLVIGYLLKLLVERSKGLALPIADRAPDDNFTESLVKAATKYPDTPFILPTSPPQIVLPNHLINEIKTLKQNELSMRKALYRTMQGRYTALGTGDHEELISAIKIDLTRNLSSTLSDLQEEVTLSVGTEVGDCLEWTPINVYHKLTRIVAQISGRIFVGLPLCRDEEWIDMSINYTTETVAGVQTVSKYYSWMRPFIAPFLSDLQRLSQRRRRAAEMLKPVVGKMLEGHRNRSKDQSSDDDDTESSIGKDQFNMISWMIPHYSDVTKVNPVKIGEEQLLIAFAAIHTTSMTASHAIYDLAAHPQHIPELRQEIEDIITAENYPDRRLKKSSMPKLRKLDSFIKESQRMNPLGLLSMPRVVTAPEGLKLSTGHTIPHDTHIAFPHTNFPNMPPSSLSTINKTPQAPFDQFDPFRFSNMRSVPGQDNFHQFVTTGLEQINFGHGPGACPGRFFASNEIKVILVELLKDYDIALGPNGEGEQAEYKRPATFVQGTSRYPDPTAEIYFRRRAKNV